MPKSPFIKEDFLLETEYARDLYHKYAKDLPIVDFHCHLPPEDVANDRRYANMTEIWLAGDHYKWRAMRANGVPERYCTGDASDWDKFEKWAETVPYCIRNPIYHWVHMELRRPFGIKDRLFGPETAKGIWEACNALLATPEFSARGIMKKMNVALVCTTDDPADDLEPHRRTAEAPDFDIQMLPTWRPDRALLADRPQAFCAWLQRLEAASGMPCDSYDRLLEVLYVRARHFAAHGCRAADHGLEVPYAEDYTLTAVREAFNAARSGRTLAPEAALQYKSALLYELGLLNHKMNWVQQLHLGPIRNTNSRMFQALGPDAGYDSVGDQPLAVPLARWLDRLDQTSQLSRTILYTINPAANMVIATMTGNFQDGSCPGKIQFGSGWWFNDQMDGMLRQLETLSQTGLLSRFVGMLTDSRSFLSYPRHDYFRRILCNLLGSDIMRGRLPASIERPGHIVQDICHNNAVRYFGFHVPLAGENIHSAGSRPTRQGPE